MSVTSRAIQPRRKVTYVLPVFNEAENLALFQAELADVTSARADLHFEFLYVDDGSSDGSLRTLLDLREADPRISVIQLARNSGHQIAVTAGLDAARDADAVIVMDTDLQDPPAVSIQLIERWLHGADVVYAQRRTRQDGAFKRGTAWLFYWGLERLSETPIPRNTGDFRLMDKRVVAEVARYREHDRFLRGIVAHVGFAQEAVLFDRDPRHAGTSGYPLRSMLRFAADGVIGFSATPLRLISRIGVLISALSMLAALYVVAVRIFDPGDTVPGWAFLGVGIFFMGGLQLVMMGVIGSYVGRVYTEVQDRPLYAVALAARGERTGVARIDRSNERSG